MSLKNKVALVTGGGRGIGRETALLFAAEGAKVAISARNSHEILEVTAQIKNTGGAALAVAGDVSLEGDVKRVIDETVSEFGGVDILVNNAGILRYGPIVTMESSEWRDVIEVNLMGTYYCTKAVVPILLERGWGRIINISSRSGKIGRPTATAYCASKHAVIGFTKALAEELTPFNITVNAVCPGVVDTDMVPETVKEEVGPGIVRPHQVASLVVYLASEECGAINGEAINIFGNSKLEIRM